MPMDTTLHPSQEPDIDFPAALRSSDVMLAATLALASTSAVPKGAHDKCSRCMIKAEGENKPVGGDKCFVWLDNASRKMRFSGICISCLVFRDGSVRKARNTCSLHGMIGSGQQRELAIEIEDDEEVKDDMEDDEEHKGHQEEWLVEEV